ncbi:UNVERIFIED_CONTAM: hypothetical protein Sradi_3068900 [Sesamum radiatum]|uniref:Uncharacterized protein n=1 Tax=Sesamum radiatum TaxID=300843 RepID=A0AAW2RC22_SESRA
MRLFKLPADCSRFPFQRDLGTDDVMESATSVSLRADSTIAASGNNPIMVEEDTLLHLYNTVAMVAQPFQY